MAQGQDRIASSLLELQPTAIIELFLLYFNTVDNPNAFIAFHGGSVYNQGIVWQGIEYLPIPVETDGFEVNANGQLARPKMRISNKDYFATDLLINNDDLQFAKVVRKRTFVKYLDDVNFDGGNPWGQADASAELSNDTFVVGQKTAENKVFIELELTSPLDLENFEVNNRLIMSRYCSWHYRGNGCNYRGIPIATEEGQKLVVANPVDWFANQALKKWSEQGSYVSGDAAYIENQKITIVDPKDASQTEFAKIWYVCQSGHSSSSSTIPDKNPSLWKRDGCNKKLDGCKLRFGKGAIEFNELTEERTAYFVDSTSRNKTTRYNNIAPSATISASSATAVYPVTNTADLISGSTSIWQASGTLQNQTITLEWSEPKNINRIDIYDNPSSNPNFNNAYIRYFNTNNNPNPFASGVLQSLLDNGTRSTTGFANRLVNKIIISGSGGYGVSSLSEIAVFETNSPNLVYYDQESIPLHRNEFFQISTWIQLSGRDIYPNELYSVFHNISGGCRYSGLNLYLSGENLLLDFATRTTGATPQQINRTLALPWNNDELRPLHLICSGGNATGISPTATNPGYIELTDGISEPSRFILSGSTGEYFRFKNPDYQSGIVANQYRLKFGLNDWQFPTGNEFVPNPLGASNQIISNMKLISPIKFGPTAFWTGSSGVNVRIDEHNQSVYRDYTDFTGKAANTGDLLAWWEMATGLGTLEISAQNNSSKKLIISGDSSSIFNTPETASVSLAQILNTPKQNIELPFGGFPGTEKYG